MLDWKWRLTLASSAADNSVAFVELPETTGSASGLRAATRGSKAYKHLGDLRLLLFELLLVDASHPGEGLDAEEGAEGGLAVLARGRDGGEHLLPYVEVRARTCVTVVTRASVSAFRTRVH